MFMNDSKSVRNNNDNKSDYNDNNKRAALLFQY